jgi:hypothetical protein
LRYDARLIILGCVVQESCIFILFLRILWIDIFVISRCLLLLCCWRLLLLLFHVSLPPRQLFGLNFFKRQLCLKFNPLLLFLELFLLLKSGELLQLFLLSLQLLLLHLYFEELLLCLLHLC